MKLKRFSNCESLSVLYEKNQEEFLLWEPESHKIWMHKTLNAPDTHLASTAAARLRLHHRQSAFCCCSHMQLLLQAAQLSFYRTFL